MSDEPSDAQKLIAEVMVTHALVYDDWAVVDADFYTCACGWHLSTSASVHDHAAHVAVEVDKALGGLTRKRRIDHQWRETGEVHHDRFFEGKPVPKTRLHYVQQSRWASGWTVTE